MERKALDPFLAAGIAWGPAANHYRSPKRKKKRKKKERKSILIRRLSGASPPPPPPHLFFVQKKRGPVWTLWSGGWVEGGGVTNCPLSAPPMSPSVFAV